MSAESLDLFASAAAAQAPAYTPAPTIDDVPRFDAASAEPLPMGVTMLEASAGTGKTYSIASLVLRLVVEEGLGIDEILVVTFTEAATSELRDRIRRRLRDALTLAERALAAGASPATDGGAARDEVGRALVARAIARGALADMVAALRTALGRFDDAPITTIHGFCHRVLRERAFECGGELEAELLTDDTELLEAVVRDFWARETAARPVALVEALVARAKVGLVTLRALARRAVRHPESACMPALDGVDGSSLEALLAERARLAEDLAGRWTGDDTSDALALVGEARVNKVLNGNKWREGALEARAEVVSAWAVGAAAAPLPEKELRCFGASALRDACNKGKEPPAHSLFRDVDALLDADARVQGAALVEALRLQHACVGWARAELARRKRAGRLHGFDDLLRLVCGALRRDEQGTLAAALRASFRAALIDEFQDTDDVQWDIFRRAFADPAHRLVLIGDPKQSIYAFRGADVEAYLAARGTAATRWALDANWRTDGALVDALHALWGAHPAPFAEREIGWRRVRASHAARRLQGAGAPLRFRFLAREGSLAPTGTSPLITKERLAPRLPTLVASDVARWLGSGATIVERVGGHDRARSARPADVAVLVRSHRQAREIQAALRRAGVPAVIHGAESVFASREARELIAVLAAVLEPASPSLARGALATDLLGLAAAAELPGDGAPRGPGDLLAALDADDARWDTWAERLRAWRAAWRGEGTAAAAPGVMRLVRALCDELALPARLLALVDGERRLTNLLHLGELLHAASTERALAPGATLAWLREQVANAGAGRDDAARQLRLESDDEAAKVVTVHSSKGLEYGAVWCPYLWDGRLSLDADLTFPHVPVAGAPSPRAIDLRGGRSSPAAARVDDERFAESLRLAYVAMTRARHQLTIWWGATSSFDSSPLAWLLHGEEAADAQGERSARAALLELQLKSLDDDALHGRLDALAASAPGLIDVEDEDAESPPVRWRAPDAPRPALAARAWTRTRPLDDGWRMGSFTGLTRGAHAVAESEDAVDAPEALDDARGGAVEETGDVPLAAFPASAQAGLFFHEVLERHDPAAPESLAPLVEDRLHAYGFPAERWAGPVHDALRGVLDAPLATEAGVSLRLRGVPRADRMTELRFELPACADDGPAITSAALARVFRDHPGGTLDAAVLARYADQLATLDFRPLRGFLTGAIDLVARHAGRWWLFDWKSNRLGARRADYAPERMAREMTDAHYVLQYHLYALALHRWLAWRQPGYDWDRDVGGACYIFLRGVGDGTGVFVDRPPRARIAALDRLFREGA